MVSEKGLEGNHHGFTDNALMSFALHLLGEDSTWVDDSRYVLHIENFGLMEFTNHVLPEVEVFDTF